MLPVTGLKQIFSRETACCGFLCIFMLLKASGQPPGAFFGLLAGKGKRMFLQLKQVTVTHTKDLRVLIDRFSFTLNPGDKVAIIGEEGNGKSTLLQLMAGREPAYCEVTGEIIRRGRFAYLPQEMEESDKEQSVYEFFCSEEGFFDFPPAESARLASSLGLPAEEIYSERPMKSYSGGEQVKFSLLRLLFGHPDVLLLDEPSNNLDLETLTWLEKFIAQSEQPVVFISHDEVLLERTANGIIHLEQVKKKQQPRATVAHMDYRRYVSQRADAIDKQEQLALNERRDFDAKMEKYRQIRQRVEHEQNSISRADPHGGRLLKKKMHTVQAMGKRFEREKENLTERPVFEEAMFLNLDEDVSVPAGKIVLDFSLDSLCTGGRCLARNLSLTVRGGEKLCIIGQNGAGKSTLLRLIRQELNRRADIKVGYMPQNYEEELDLDASPVEFLAPSGDKEKITQVRTYLGSMKYTHDEMLHPIRGLSGGQKAKLFLLKLKLERADVLLLDEPTRNFSPLSAPVVRDLIARFNGTVISVSHDRRYMQEVCTRVLKLTPNGLEAVEVSE